VRLRLSSIAENDDFAEAVRLTNEAARRDRIPHVCFFQFSAFRREHLLSTVYSRLIYEPRKCADVVIWMDTIQQSGVKSGSIAHMISP